MTDGLLELIQAGGSYTLIGVASLIAYRLTKQASADAVVMYRESAESSAGTLGAERLAWAAEREALLAVNEAHRMANEAERAGWMVERSTYISRIEALLSDGHDDQ